MREDQNLEKIYFYLLPFTRAITKDTKKKFNKEVNRISSKAKVTDLLESSKELIDLVKYEYTLLKLFEKFKILAILVNYIGLWKDTAFLLAIAINLIILSEVEKRDGETYISPSK